MKSTEQVLTEIRNERRELHQKIDRLTSTVVRHGKISERHWQLMNHQLEAMKLYEFTLTERIHDLVEVLR